MSENWWETDPLAEEDKWWETDPAADEVEIETAPPQGFSQVTQPDDSDPRGTGLGRAIKRGAIRASSSIPAMQARSSITAIDRATKNPTTTGGAQLQAQSLRQEADALEAELPNVDDPDAADTLRDEILYLRQRAETMEIGSTTPSMKAGQARAEEIIAREEPKAIDALVRLRELNDRAAAIPFSPAAKAASERLAQAPDTVMGTLSALSEKPLQTAAFLGEVAAESSPMIAGSIAAALITKNPTLSAAILGGGAMTQEYGASVDQFLREEGVTLETEADAAALLKNPEVMKEASRRGLRRGVVIAAAEMIGQGATVKATRSMSAIKGAAASTGIQAVTGGAGEAAAMAAAGQEVSPREVIIEAIAETVTAPLEIGSAVISDRQERASSKRLTAADRASPIPNDVIDDGKALMEQIVEGQVDPLPGPDTPPAMQTAPPGGPVAPTPDQAPDVPQGAVPLDVLYETPQQPAQEPGTGEVTGVPEVSPPQAPQAAPARPETPAVDQFPTAPETAPQPEVSDQIEVLPVLDGDKETGQMVQFDPETNSVQLVQPEVPAAPEPDAVPEVDQSDRSNGRTPEREEIEAAAAETEPNPTDAQKEAENYKTGKVRWNGLELSIENAKGSERSGKDPDGNEWSVTMPAHYGRILKSTGADGDHVDIYMGENPKSDFVAVVDQVDPETKAHDEHKVILGTNTQEEAEALYEAGFSDGKGRDRIGGVTTMTVEEFKSWVREGDTTKPLADIYDAEAQRRDAIKSLNKKGFKEPPKGMKSPFIHGMPKIDPRGRAAQELKHLGVNTRTAPQLFRNGGLKELDNQELGVWRNRYPDAKDDGTGNYVDQQWFYEKLADEVAGVRVPSVEQQRVYDEHNAWEAEVESEISGIPVNTADDTPKQIDIIPPRNEDTRSDQERTADVRMSVKTALSDLGISDEISAADRGAIVMQMVRDGGEVYDAIYDRAYSLIVAAEQNLSAPAETDTIPFTEEDFARYAEESQDAAETAGQDAPSMDAGSERVGQQQRDTQAEGQRAEGGQDTGGDAGSVERTEAGAQQVIPGAEQSQERSNEARKGDQKREVDARAQQSKMRTATPQDAAGPLFDTQQDMFDAPVQKRTDQERIKKPETTIDRAKASIKATDPLRKRGDWQDSELIVENEDGTEAEINAGEAVGLVQARLRRAVRLWGCLNA